ncbi:MAG: hypothetical protein K8I27_01340 [Planctomycetes bacterium]|nr:hypothetical protein [Planctomycetota bacterium]
MYLNTANLKHHVAAANRGRYALNAIALTERGTLSTDGHSLLFVPYPEVDANDAPKIEGINSKAKPPKLALLDPADAAKAAAMVSGKGRKSTLPAFNLIHAEVKKGSIVLGSTDGAGAQVMTCQQAEGQYPDVAVVIPDYKKAHVISVNIDTLLRSLKALKGATDEDVVTIRVIDDQQAVGMSCKDGTAMLVMPVQVDKPEDHVSDKLAALRNEGPPVAAPVDPDEEADKDAEEDAEAWEPTETEMAEAFEAFTALPPLPEHASA